MANLSTACGEIQLGQTWPRRTVVALAYVLSIGDNIGGYGIWNASETLQNADALSLGKFKFEGCGKWTISNTLRDMFYNFSDWLKDSNYGTGRVITSEEMLIMYKILVKDMFDEGLDFTINYVDYEPGTSRLVSGTMSFKSNDVGVYFGDCDEEDLPYTMGSLIREFDWDKDYVLDLIDAATYDMDLDGVDRRDFFNDVLKAIMDGEADNLNPDPYWTEDDIPEFVLTILNKHLKKI